MQNNLNAQLQDELQNDANEHIILIVLVEQLGENMDVMTCNVVTYGVVRV